MAPNFWPEVYFLPASFFMRRGKRKKSQGLDQEKRVDVLKYRPPVLSKTKSLFRHRDLRCCHVTNKCHRFPSSTFLVEFD